MTASPGPAAIAVDHLTVQLGATVALRDVSLSVGSGELLAIAGPNGSGKTTLIRSILGLIAPNSGRIMLAGVPSGRLTLPERARYLSWMPQEELPGDNVTLFEYVLFGRHPHVPRFGGESDSDRLAARKALDEVGLWDRASDRTWEISGGERQRLRLARVLAQSTPGLLLDEPTAHLDMAHQLEVLERVRRLCHRERCAGVTALHDLNLAARFADRVAVLHHGRLVADGPAADVLSPALLQEVWGIVADLREDPRSGVPYLIPRLPPETPRLPSRTPPLRVHVVAGGGSASTVLRRLWERGFALTTGVVALFDTDHTTAEEFGIPVATEVPFAPLSDESRAQHRRLLAAADRIVVAPFPVGPGNLANLEDLLPWAHAKPIFLLAAPGGASRDFSGGASAAVRDRLVSAGARRVEGLDELIRELETARPWAGVDRADAVDSDPTLAS